MILYINLYNKFFYLFIFTYNFINKYFYKIHKIFLLLEYTELLD